MLASIAPCSSCLLQKHGFLLGKTILQRFLCEGQHCTFSTDSSAYETIAVANDGGVGVLTLSRPKTMNALSSKLMHELTCAARDMDKDDSIKCMIIASSSTKAFAAGADIKEMAGLSYADTLRCQLFKEWAALQDIKKPMIAAVNGYALGGGFELALMCDIIVASEQAQFGLPEVNLGVIPGIGGTQRLTKLVGKSRAMDIILTGRRLSASEALQMGIVSRVVAADQLNAEVKKVAQTIASFPSAAVTKAKAAVNVATEASLQEGLRYERSEFWSCFALPDQKERMLAFIEKRQMGPIVKS